ncbi:MAG: alpha/beta hydrolase [Victivallales bacterium]|nr:alpha/beta hydrolase [Victivallales bacterium]
MEKKLTLTYSNLPGVAGDADLILPDECLEDRFPVLLLHGGGWSAMDKKDVIGIASFLAENGYPVLNANYRLSNDVPWPACAEDCLTAARYLLDNACNLTGHSTPRQILVVGASAGGHLALFTGLSMPTEYVAGIIAISPIAVPEPDFAVYPNRYQCLFGHPATQEDLVDINPARLLSPASPPIFISHSRLDTIVPIESSRLFLEKTRSMGVHTMFDEYDGIGDGHRIWRPGITPHRLLSELEEAILKFLKTLPPTKSDVN